MSANPPNDVVEVASTALFGILRITNKSRYNDMIDGYCENCLNPAECYQSGRCWPVVDHQPDAGKLCAEMDDAFSDCIASKLCSERLKDILLNLTHFEESLARRTEKAEEEECDLVITEQEAWKMLDIISFVQTLPIYLPNAEPTDR